MLFVFNLFALSLLRLVFRVKGVSIMDFYIEELLTVSEAVVARGWFLEPDFDGDIIDDFYDDEMLDECSDL
jgi:hypothetical protein